MVVRAEVEKKGEFIMNLFNKMLIVIILAVSTNAFCFLGDIISGAGEAVADVTAGAANVAADTVDVVTDPYYYDDGYYYYGRYPRSYRYGYGYYPRRHFRPFYNDYYYDDYAY